MDFFNKLGKKASETYKATTEATGKLAREAKLRMKMNESKSNIKDIYAEIGKKVYEKHIREENINIKEELEEELAKIDVLAAEIETFEKEILELKDKKHCSNCHAELDISASFCPSCGAKQEPREEKNEENIEVLDENGNRIENEENNNEENNLNDQNNDNQNVEINVDLNVEESANSNVEENNEPNNNESNNQNEEF